jgi:hypothetical protein
MVEKKRVRRKRKVNNKPHTSLEKEGEGRGLEEKER